MSDLKLNPGDVIPATKWNGIVDRLPASGSLSSVTKTKLVLCRATEEIDAAVLDATDTADSLYSSGLVDTYALIDNEDGTYSPVITTSQRIVINPAVESIPIDTEFWASEAVGGYLIASVWGC